MTERSYTCAVIGLQQDLPDATLIVYPDSNHGPHDQYPAFFVKHVTTFLEEIK